MTALISTYFQIIINAALFTYLLGLLTLYFPNEVIKQFIFFPL